MTSIQLNTSSIRLQHILFPIRLFSSFQYSDSPPLFPGNRSNSSRITINKHKNPILKTYSSHSGEFMDTSATVTGLISEPVKEEIKKDVYSVWALPPEDVKLRLKKLMEGLRSEFGGPEFEPHVTVVGAIRLTKSEALDLFNRACEGLKAYNAEVEKVATGTFFYQCVFLLLHPTSEVMEASVHCTSHFGYKTSAPYMPHLSLLYGDLTDEEKKKAQEKANVLDSTISSLSFQISSLELCKSDIEDRSCKSWEKVAECELKHN